MKLVHVDKVRQAYLRRRDGEEGGERNFAVVVAGGNPSKLLDLVEHLLDAITILLSTIVTNQWVLAASSGRNCRVCAVK